MSASQDKRVVLVTGANKGIGYEAVNILSQKLPTGTVYLASRSVQNGEAAIASMRKATPSHSFENVRVISLDVERRSSVEAAVEKIRSEHGKLDVLLHNSGISSVNGDHFAKGVFDVNVTGTKTVVDAFVPIIPAGGHLVVVSSEVGTWMMHTVPSGLRESLDNPAKVTWQYIEDLINDFQAFAEKKPAKQDWPPTSQLVSNYCVSKMLQTAWVRSFALQHPDLKVALVCPGYCATELNGFSGPRPASMGGASVTWPIFHSEFENGKLYQDGKVLDFTSPMPDNMFK